MYARALLGAHFSAALLEASDRLRAAQREITAELDGGRLTHGQLLAAWRRAPDAAARERAATATDAVLHRLTGEQQRWLEEYARVRRALGFETQAALIRALHPASLDGSRDKFYWFLSGWMGGPDLFIERFGHPRLRARHLPFAIGSIERDQWLRCMALAMQDVEVEQGLQERLMQSFYQTADWMRNKPD